MAPQRCPPYSPQNLYILHGQKKKKKSAGRHAACAAGENNEGVSTAAVMSEINQTQKALTVSFYSDEVQKQNKLRAMEVTVMSVGLGTERGGPEGSLCGPGCCYSL